MEKSTIVNSIKLEIRKNSSSSPLPYSSWTIGVTDDPSARKSQHERDGHSIEHWMVWNADSEQDAREIERHFIILGMKGHPGGQGTADYVYIFKTTS